MKLLFISRAYPPIVGGLEKHNQALHDALREKIHVDAIINRKGKKALPWFLLFATIKALFHAREYDAVLLGDGVLAAVGWVVKLLYPATPVICIIHGLDITYSNPVYRVFWVNRFLPKMDRLIAVSQATANEAIHKGLPSSKLVIIPNGIHRQEHQHRKDRKQLEELLRTDTENKIILFTLGRLVKRKGVNWFIQRVMPEIKDNCIYLIAGDGPEKTAITKSIQDNRLEQSVFCFGYTTEEQKSLLFSNTNLFIQPNIKVDGDMEGFGIAVLEANSYSVAVLGSKLEGLQDSITENQNGWLLEPENAAAYIQKITDLSKSPEELQRTGDNAKSFCLQFFCWDRIVERYIDVINTRVSSIK
jgi:glycosyltransferase involved in cell wall biosynthesis